MKNNLKRGSILFFIIFILIVSCYQPISALNIEKTLMKNVENQILSSDDFDGKIEFLMKFAHAPSLSACIIIEDEMVWSDGYGYFDIKNQKIPDEDTIYMAGSISKTFTSVALLQLYEQGLFDLDDDVNDYLPFNLRNPDYPNESITIRMLLSHQSSLSEPVFSFLMRYFFFDYSYEWLEEFLIPGGCIYDPSVWSDRHPGEGFEYANIGFEILGYIFELISNETLEDYCEQNIFQPLGMQNTSFHVDDFDICNLAIPYVRKFGLYLPLPHYNIGSSAAGSIRTSISDLSKYLIMHMNEGVYDEVRILEEDTIEMMHTIQYPGTSEYGLGWFIIESNGEIYSGHTGGVFGGIAIMFYRESDNVGVIFFINMNRVFRLWPHYLELFSIQQIQAALFERANDFL